MAIWIAVIFQFARRESRAQEINEQQDLNEFKANPANGNSNLAVSVPNKNLLAEQLIAGLGCIGVPARNVAQI